MNQLEEFCAAGPLGPAACKEGLEWARSAGCATTGEAWERCERSDWMIWILRRANILDKHTWVRIAVEMAADVLPIYEAQHPDRSAPRFAIDAARAWLADPTEDNAAVAYTAAAAAAAAYDAYADDAAAAKIKKKAEQADLLRSILGNPFAEPEKKP